MSASHDAHASADGFPRPHYKEYWVIFSALSVLTLAELALVKLREPLGDALFIASLVLFAIVKAALVGLFFMHLRHETRVLRWTVIGPLTLPFFYAAVLIAEAAWRLIQAAPATWQ